MASQHIEISGTATRYSGQMRSFVDELQGVVNLAAKLKTIADQYAFGGDYTSLGTALGLNATDAQTVYNILGSVNTTLSTDSFIAQMLSRLG